MRNFLNNFLIIQKEIVPLHYFTNVFLNFAQVSGSKGNRWRDFQRRSTYCSHLSVVYDVFPINEGTYSVSLVVDDDFYKEVLFVVRNILQLEQERSYTGGQIEVFIPLIQIYD